MKFILGKKITMTQVYRDDGSAVPVTKVAVGPCVVTQVKHPTRDGYAAVQVGFGRRRSAAKPQLGHTKGIGPFAVLREFRLDRAELEQLQVGDRIGVATFQAGDQVKVTGTAKGRGFQGVVRRHHFAGSPKTHGHKDQLRMPGSSGAGGVQRVRPGKRMPGRMGGHQVSVKNLEVVAVDTQESALYLKGAVPGSPGSVLIIQGPGSLQVEKAVTPPAATAGEKSEIHRTASEAPRGEQGSTA